MSDIKNEMIHSIHIFIVQRGKKKMIEHFVGLIVGLTTLISVYLIVDHYFYIENGFLKLKDK